MSIHSACINIRTSTHTRMQHTRVGTTSIDFQSFFLCALLLCVLFSFYWSNGKSLRFWLTPLKLQRRLAIGTQSLGSQDTQVHVKHPKPKTATMWKKNYTKRDNWHENTDIRVCFHSKRTLATELAAENMMRLCYGECILHARVCDKQLARFMNAMRLPSRFHNNLIRARKLYEKNVIKTLPR